MAERAAFHHVLAVHPVTVASRADCPMAQVRTATAVAKEAVAFALLGYLTLHGQPGNVPAATGASGARVLGTVTPP